MVLIDKALKPFVEANLKAVATKGLRKDIAKELQVDDPENAEDVLEKNEITDDDDA